MTSGIRSGHRHEHAGALAFGRADESDGAGRETCALERRAQNLVDEHRDSTESGTARTEDSRVQALQQLARDVERDVRPRFEVRSDGSDRDSALADPQAVRQCPRFDLALERRDRSHGLDLPGEAVDPVLVEAQPVEHAFVEAIFRRLVVGGVRREDLGAALPDEGGGGHERRSDSPVVQVPGCTVGLESLGYHFTTKSHRSVLCRIVAVPCRTLTVA